MKPVVISMLGLISGVCLSMAGCHAEGKKVFQSNRCPECHTINGKGGSAAPNLSNVGSRRTPEFIRQQIRDSKINYPNTNMPSFKNLSDKDMNALVDYLSSLK
ncbi:MAG TPA: cytochrome c [Nitrospirota bacterium]|nr:cytochrome c [Nitrospirota bacterium]